MGNLGRVVSPRPRRLQVERRYGHPEPVGLGSMGPGGLALGLGQLVTTVPRDQSFGRGGRCAILTIPS